VATSRDFVAPPLIRMHDASPTPHADRLALDVDRTRPALGGAFAAGGRGSGPGLVPQLRAANGTDVHVRTRRLQVRPRELVGGEHDVERQTKPVIRL
jgi:hypothetical protein